MYKRPVPGGLGFKIVVTVGFRCRAAPAAASQMHYIVYSIGDIQPQNLEFREAKTGK